MKPALALLLLAVSGVIAQTVPERFRCGSAAKRNTGFQPVRTAGFQPADECTGWRGPGRQDACRQHRLEACVPAETKVGPTFRDISYGPHERHKLDVWRAKSNGPTPLVIFIHGGGWHGGDKADVPPKLRDFLLARGVSVASINYRYTSIAILPAPVHDAARAVQFLRTKASEWKLDPKRFAACGVSAGGCTTLWLAYHDDLADPRSADPVARQSSRLQAAVGISPQTCLEPETVTAWIGDQVLQHPMIARSVQAKKTDNVRNPKPEWARLLREFSPITHVTAGDPPVLLSYPRADPLPAPTSGSAIHHAIFGVKLKEKAYAAGVMCVLRIEDQKDKPTPTPEEFLIKQLEIAK